MMLINEICCYNKSFGWWELDKNREAVKVHNHVTKKREADWN